MKRMLWIIIILLMINSTYAYQNKITLLAVSETDQGVIGSTADLILETKPGTGQVFIDSFPLTKIDTQITTRFAKEIACSYLNLDCSKYNFFYTMRASSAIVGGASAGAATTILTIATLANLPLDSNVAITGTINSGDLIGPVSGLKEKIDAASQKKISTVLIPQTQEIYKSEKKENITINLTEHGLNKSVLVKEVATIPDALKLFNLKIQEPVKNYSLDANYLEIMKGLSEKLCNRSLYMKNQINQISTNLTKEDLILKNESENFLNKSRQAKIKGLEYSSASYCYGANTKYRQIIINNKNWTKTDLMIQAKQIAIDTDNLDINIEKKFPLTITDLEAYMIVKERISDTRDNLEKFDELMKSNNRSLATFYLANAYERYYSGQSWTVFFGQPGTIISLDTESLQKTCNLKIAEAEERYEYISLIFPNVQNIKDEISDAEKSLRERKYGLCIFQASKAKAETNVILSGLNVEVNQIDYLIEQKLKAASESIAKENAKGMFPILGYSYYEYANSLKNESQSLSLLYAEYGIELSNLDMYFDMPTTLKSSGALEKIKVDYILISIFVAGVLIGILLYDVKSTLNNEPKNSERKRDKESKKRN